MPRTAAGHNVNFVNRANFLVGQMQFGDNDLTVHNPRGKRVAHGFRLFGDFFFHEMRIAAFFRRFGVPGDVVNVFFNRLAVRVVEFNIFARQNRDFAVV